eukprot:COSAG05_NODE_15487_length_368_cov_0.855019_1_plen_122_part_11
MSGTGTNRCVCNAMGARKASNCSAKSSRGLKLCPGPPASDCRNNVSFALAALKQQGGSQVATSFFLYCGLEINATGELAVPVLSTECLEMVIGLKGMGIKSEPVVGASLPALQAMFKSPSAS